jgi:hypothetical protein
MLTNHCMNILHSIHQTVVANPVRDEKPKIINAKKLFSSIIILKTMEEKIMLYGEGRHLLTVHLGLIGNLLIVSK